MRTGLPWTWGSTPAEDAHPYPADDVFTGPTVALNRAVSVAAPAELAYRWLCQVKVAPYSYDLIDNRGRRSPTELTPGADELTLGEPMIVFALTDIRPGRQWTGVTFGRYQRMFGRIAATYAVEPVDGRSCRMLCRLVFAQPHGLDRVRALALSWGDLVMMRRQLLNLKRYAERDAALAPA